MRIHLAISHFLLQQGLKSVCESTGVYTVSSESAQWFDLQLALEAQSIDLLVMSTGLQGLSLEKDIAWLKQQYPSLPILLIDSAQHKIALQQLNDLGISCILHTDCAQVEILKGIEHCLAGESFICSRILNLQKSADSYLDSTGNPVKISKREADIIHLIAQGHTSKEISAKLILSFHTVATHRKNIFKKLNVNSAAELTSLVFNQENI